jgi:hypothetical protein
MALTQLLFVDTNIWLDFYRARNETGLKLLDHTEAISDRLIVTYQVESEFKKNRQHAILEGMQELKTPPSIPRLGIFSDAGATRVMARNLKEIDKRVGNLKRRLAKVLDDPALHDPVYKACQRIFHKTDKLTLSRTNPLRKKLRSMAFKRFLHGCPPRKKGDTSIGDAINWEWIVHCANEQQANIVIVTRDADYGVTVGTKSYINDHLRQEFSQRVSKKRKLELYTSLSDALKKFSVHVSKEEENDEKELLATDRTSASLYSSLRPRATNLSSLSDLLNMTQEQYKQLLAAYHSAVMSEVGSLLSAPGSKKNDDEK